VTDNETNLEKWTAFARTSDPEAVGHTLNELAGDIERLRGVCRLSAERLVNVKPWLSSYHTAYESVGCLITDLANEGSKDGL